MSTTPACDGCRNGDAFPVDCTMAFQPIVEAVDQLLPNAVYEPTACIHIPGLLKADVAGCAFLSVAC